MKPFDEHFRSMVVKPGIAGLENTLRIKQIFWHRLKNDIALVHETVVHVDLVHETDWLAFSVYGGQGEVSRFGKHFCA